MIDLHPVILRVWFKPPASLLAALNPTPALAGNQGLALVLFFEKQEKELPRFRAARELNPTVKLS